MSTQGILTSLETRKKQSLANTKDRTEMLAKVEEYINNLSNSDFPSIVDASIHAQISEGALLAYELRTAENSEVRILLDIIRDKSKSYLMKNSLNKSADSRTAIFLLQANHGMKNDNPNLTQNNIFNVSPEILAEAIEISRTSKK